MNRTILIRNFQSISCFLLIGFIAGCGCDLFPNIPQISSELEPNDNFGIAQKISLDNNSTTEISGTLSSSNDIDMFDIGSLTAGTKLDVEIKSIDSPTQQSVTIALFDNEDDIARLEDVEVSASVYKTAFTHIIQKSGIYYLGISAENSYISGSFDYTIRVDKSSASTPTSSSQVVYLDFDGADNIVLDGDLFSHLAPLSSATGSYDDKQVADMIVDMVEQDYDDLNIQFVSSYYNSPPTITHTAIYITGNDDEYLGLSEHIDWYNDDHSDCAIIFAGAFNANELTLTEYAQSIANVASHELGHLLGLIHTDDDTEIMDEATPFSLLEEDQNFHRAPIIDFPIGYQDALDLLNMILGMNL